MGINLVVIIDIPNKYVKDAVRKLSKTIVPAKAWE